MKTRSITHAYDDPLALIWIDCACKLGFKVRRTSEAYASYDGDGTLLIGDAETLDSDDHLGQIILHELCHALVQGPESERLVDWGLSNHGKSYDPWREHATLRVQAWLAASVGLRDFFAPTTDYRESFWNVMGQDPLGPMPSISRLPDRSQSAAILAIHRATLPRWQRPLEEALVSTQRLAQVIFGLRDGSQKSFTTTSHLPCLWDLVQDPPSQHPSGQSWIADWLFPLTCGECAWGFSIGRGFRCRHNPKQSFPSQTAACARYEPSSQMNCETCGACCREAFDTVELDSGERTVQRYPEWVIREGDRLKLSRSQGACVALKRGQDSVPSFRCDIYRDRPKTCRGFTMRSEACLEARQRVGLSR